MSWLVVLLLHNRVLVCDENLKKSKIAEPSSTFELLLGFVIGILMYLRRALQFQLFIMFSMVIYQA